MDIFFRYVWTPFVVVFVGAVLLRWMGRRAVAEMDAFDLIVVLILGTTVTEPIVTKRLGIASYYSLAVALFFIAFSRLRLMNPVKRWVLGKPNVLVKGGDIDMNGLRRARLTVEDLLKELRVKGYVDVHDVEMATMELSGKVSVIPKEHARPLQVRDVQPTAGEQLTVVPEHTFIPLPLIVDGDIVAPNLRYLNKDRDWLFVQLQAYGLTEKDVARISLATYNRHGTVDVDQ